MLQSESALFFAIKGERHDGHKFIADLFNQGVRNFIVSELNDDFKDLNANFIVVDDALKAMQRLAAHHRQHFNYNVIGITGSNGKTIVKEWLYQLLRADLNIVRSPKSYNSQIGVPISVWEMQEENQLAIFEAGISMPGEMKKLEAIIHPTVGIFTNIGSAHDENFSSEKEKVHEKLELFSGVKTLIYNKDYTTIQESVNDFSFREKDIKIFSWSRKSRADLQVGRVTKSNDDTEIQAVFENEFINITIPFIDDASVENAINCWSLMLVMGYDQTIIQERMHMLSPVAMRLEMKTGINNCSVINDSYNSDIGSLTIALDFLNQQKQHENKTLILSDILQSGKNEEALYKEVGDLLKAKGITSLIGIGPATVSYTHLTLPTSDLV